MDKAKENTSTSSGDGVNIRKKSLSPERKAASVRQEDSIKRQPSVCILVSRLDQRVERLDKIFVQYRDSFADRLSRAEDQCASKIDGNQFEERLKLVDCDVADVKQALDRLQKRHECSQEQVDEN